jgi:hypothetical protein
VRECQLASFPTWSTQNSKLKTAFRAFASLLALHAGLSARSVLARFYSVIASMGKILNDFNIIGSTAV